VQYFNYQPPKTMNIQSFNPVVRAAVCCIALFLVSSHLNAQTVFTWSGNGSGDLWSTGANWVGGNPPPAATHIELVFGASSKLAIENDIANLGTLNTTQNANMNFTSSAGAYELSGTQIRKGPLTIQTGAAGITINLPLEISNSGSGGANFIINNTELNTINGVISGTLTQGINKQGTGTLELTADNTFTGNTNIQMGTLRVTKIGNATVAGNLGTSSTIQIGNNNDTGTLDYRGTGESTNRQVQIGSGTTGVRVGSAIILSNGSGALTFSNTTFNALNGGDGPARTLTLGGANDGVNTIAGAILDNNASAGKIISVIKQDSGQWILGGNNTYTGNTTVSAGTLLINGNQTSATGAVSVAAGATLGGNGTVGGATVINGILAPGNSIGTLSINNNVTWNFNTDNEWVFELGSAGSTMLSPGTSDRLSITGNFVKGTGTSFTFDFDGTGAAGWYQLISWTGTGSSFDVSNFQATNLAGSLTGDFFLESDGLYLQVIPEPASLGLLAMGLGLMVLLKRRQRIA